LHDQGPQFNPIGWCRLQPLEPLFGSTPQIQLSNLEEFVSIEIVYFGRHGESLCPIVNILMVSSLEQLIHSLGTSHFANIQQQTKIATPPTEHGLQTTIKCQQNQPAFQSLWFRFDL
jgi:hypothetical protein